MKKIVYSVVCLSIFMLSACNSKDITEPTTEQQLLGTWRFQKEINEFYQPTNVLLETEEIPGEPGDSIVFKNDGKVYSYSTVYGEEVTTYQLFNDTTIEIEDEIYKIRKLTTTELYLYNEYVQPVDEKYVQRLYFVR